MQDAQPVCSVRQQASIVLSFADPLIPDALRIAAGAPSPDECCCSGACIRTCSHQIARAAAAPVVVQHGCRCAELSCCYCCATVLRAHFGEHSVVHRSAQQQSGGREYHEWLATLEPPFVVLVLYSEGYFCSSGCCDEFNAACKLVPGAPHC